MGLFTSILNSFTKDFSDGAKCPVCGAKCYWDNDKDSWVCESCGYEPDGSQIEYDSETNSVNVLGIDWYCDGCGAHLNSQSGFDPYEDNWECTECGYDNDITKDNVL